MATFADTITTLRQERNKKRQEVADDLGISRASLEYYEKGKRKPDIEILAKLADYYDVSADYLLGRTTAKTTDKDLQFVCDYLGLTEKSCRLIRAFLGEDILEIRQSFNYLIEEEVFTDLACRLDKFAERFKVTACVTGRAEKRKAYDQSQLELFYAQEMLKDSFKKYIKDGEHNGNDQQA